MYLPNTDEHNVFLLVYYFSWQKLGNLPIKRKKYTKYIRNNNNNRTLCVPGLKVFLFHGKAGGN